MRSRRQRAVPVPERQEVGVSQVGRFPRRKRHVLSQCRVEAALLGLTDGDGEPTLGRAEPIVERCANAIGFGSPARDRPAALPPEKPIRVGNSLVSPKGDELYKAPTEMEERDYHALCLVAL